MNKVAAAALAVIIVAAFFASVTYVLPRISQITTQPSPSSPSAQTSPGNENLPTTSVSTNDDPDRDGLTNSQEREYGTDPNDPDTDNDGLKDGEEVLTYGTSPVDYDSDSDGIKDGEEVTKYGTDPKDVDTDNDGLKDGEEISSYGTDPKSADTDGDGLNDKEEVINYNTDPRNPDTDSDGLSDYSEIRNYGTDPLKPDSDKDGLNDGREVELNCDPLNPDTDGDGVQDGSDLFPTFDAKIYVSIKYWKELEYADPFNGHGDPYFIIYVYVYENGDWQKLTEKRIDGGSDVYERSNLGTTVINIPDDVRYVGLIISAWDSDLLGGDDKYDINGNLKETDLEIRFDVTTGITTATGNGNQDGDDPDYNEAYIEVEVGITQ